MSDEDQISQSPQFYRPLVRAVSSSSAQVRRRLLNLAGESTPHFDEMMCALGKLVLVFNILEQELKSATAYLLDPKSSDLSLGQRLLNEVIVGLVHGSGADN